MDLKDRIKTARKFAGLSQAKLAELIGAKQATISDLERGVSKGTTYIVQIAKECAVSPIWLSSGKGDMSAKDNTFPDSPTSKDYALIPYYSEGIKEMEKNKFQDHVAISSGVALPRAMLNSLGIIPNDCSVIIAQMEDMDPTIKKGETVLIHHKESAIKSGNIYLIQRGNGVVLLRRLVQQLNGWLSRCDNHDKIKYPDEPFSDQQIDSIQIVGEAVWRGGNLK